MAFDKTWAETEPAGTRDANLVDDYIRETRYAVRERMAVDHYAYADEAGHSDVGYHKIVRLMVQTSITALANAGCLYTKDVGGKAELHFKDEDDNEIQLTSAGVILLDAVMLTGDQTIAGVKTFSSIPVLPASDPTTDNQAVRKVYVDTLVADKASKGANSDITSLSALSTPLSEAQGGTGVIKYENTGTYTGDGTLGKAIAHGLGRIPKHISVVQIEEGSGQDWQWITGMGGLIKNLDGSSDVVTAPDATNFYCADRFGNQNGYHYVWIAF